MSGMDSKVTKYLICFSWHWLTGFTSIYLQFKFGVEPLPAVEDAALKTPCLAVCPTAASRASIRGVPNESQCPQVLKFHKMFDLFILQIFNFLALTCTSYMECFKMQEVLALFNMAPMIQFKGVGDTICSSNVVMC
jgi:hypothetical protein